MSTVRALRVA